MWEHVFVTSQGMPHGRFERAVCNGQVFQAELAARELGQLKLDSALMLLFLYAEREPIKYERAALRWLARYVTEAKAVSLLKDATGGRRAGGASKR